MFADFIKTAAKLIAIVAGIAIIITVVNAVTIPNFDLALFQNAIAKGKAILSYYSGDFYSLFSVGVMLLSFRFIIVPVARLTLISLRITMKANE